MFDFLGLCFLGSYLSASNYRAREMVKGDGGGNPSVLGAMVDGRAKAR